MNELRDLYQEVILDHNKSPRNYGHIEGQSAGAEGFNPLCGDRISVTVALDGQVIGDVRFEGCGCAISQASASLMTEAIKGKTCEEAKRIFERFHHMVTTDEPVEWSDGLEALGALSGVRDFPIRVKCATLAWHTLLAAFANQRNLVSTE